MRPFRTNIIALVGLGYGSVMVGFLSLWLGAGQPSVDAYDAIKEPLMALIGGSLALAKDVLRADDEGAPPEARKPQK